MLAAHREPSPTPRDRGSSKKNDSPPPPPLSSEEQLTEYAALDLSNKKSKTTPVSYPNTKDSRLSVPLEMPFPMVGYFAGISFWPNTLVCCC